MYIIVFLKIITIEASRTINILIKTLKDERIEELNYIFKLFKFKLERDKDFIIIIIINNKIAYILVINNTNNNILILYY